METLSALLIGIVVLVLWIKLMIDMRRGDAGGWFWATLALGLLLSPLVGLLVAAVWHFNVRSPTRTAA